MHLQKQPDLGRSLYRSILSFWLLACSFHAHGDISLTESNLKARFIHQFIIFSEWPESSFKNETDDYKIAIIGDEAIVNLYQNMKNTDIGKRRVKVDHLDEKASIEVLSQYHVLFIRKQYQKYAADILKSISGLPIITITEDDDIEKTNALINFLTIKKKLRFAIDEKQAKASGIKFRSQLLRLAFKED